MKKILFIIITLAASFSYAQDFSKVLSKDSLYYENVFYVHLSNQWNGSIDLFPELMDEIEVRDYFLEKAFFINDLRLKNIYKLTLKVGLNYNLIKSKLETLSEVNLIENEEHVGFFHTPNDLGQNLWHLKKNKSRKGLGC